MCVNICFFSKPYIIKIEDNTKIINKIPLVSRLNRDNVM